MKKDYYEILKNNEIAENIFKIVLKGRTSEIINPGTFVNILIEECYLRRPISIYDWNEETVTLIYKALGKGTKILSKKKEGKLDILSPLGNGYNIKSIPPKPVLIGGGIGIPPIYGLAKRILDKNPTVLLGFAKKSEVFGIEEFEKLGIKPIVQIGGKITDLIEEKEYICACGPEVMLKAAYNKSLDGQYSFEARMACGFGACMGCSCKTKYGNKRICKEGPVLTKEEIIW